MNNYELAKLIVRRTKEQNHINVHKCTSLRAAFIWVATLEGPKFWFNADQKIRNNLQSFLKDNLRKSNNNFLYLQNYVKSGIS